MPFINPHYDVSCPSCNHAFCVKPSIAMEMGDNHGHCHCPSCKSWLHLCLIPNIENATGMKAKEYLPDECAVQEEERDGE